MEIETQRCSAIAPDEAERSACMVAEIAAEWDRKVAEERRTADERGIAEEDWEEEDYLAIEASQFKDDWNSLWSRYYGSFEDTTKVPSMRFTYKKPHPDHFASTYTTLQIFSLEVAEIRGNLQWPFHVFGKVAVRDTVDHNRNMIFDCTRDNCQILTQEVPYLKLTGPARAILLLDPVTFEVDLKVKGTTESEDEHLSFLAVRFRDSGPLHSEVVEIDYTSKLSTLKFTLGIIVSSLEATISVQVTHGSWPDGFRAQFAANTSSISGEKVILLDSGDDKVPVADDGSIMLSRCVVSVEYFKKLKVSVKAWQGDKIVADKVKAIKPFKDGRSGSFLNVGFCQMHISVGWSLISVWN